LEVVGSNHKYTRPTKPQPMNIETYGRFKLRTEQNLAFAGRTSETSANQPHEPREELLPKTYIVQPRHGELRYGNSPGDPSTALRCGARTRSGKVCLGPAIRGKTRCRLHGGLSTGPRTEEGRARSRRARWIHGRYSQEAREAKIRAAEHAQMVADATADAHRILGALFGKRGPLARAWLSR
jgi:hypothetical protein